MPITIKIRRDLQLELVLVTSFLLTLRELRPQPARDAVTACPPKQCGRRDVASDAASAPIETELGRTGIQVVAAPAHAVRNDIRGRMFDEDAIENRVWFMFCSYRTAR